MGVPDQMETNRPTMTRRGINVPATTTLPLQFRVAPLEFSDSDALLAMLGRCSAAALYRRFHGVTDGVLYGQKVLAEADRRDSYVAWIGRECVGLGNLHVRDETADIGVLVQDNWQRRGVGTALLVALVRRVRERGSHFLRADVLEENRFALRVLACIGPARTSISAGSYTTLIDLEVGKDGTQQATSNHETSSNRPSNSVRQCLVRQTQ
jgi:GNAT superfamily N-acetyltransferase